jgi:hypothetical protein
VQNSTSFNNNGEAGYYDITMTDAGNGKWNVSILKTAGQMDVVPDQTYTGSAITPEPLVMAGSLNLTKGTDYEYSYTNNTNVGTAKVRATFQGTYASLGYVEKEFTIAFAPSDWADNGDGSYTIGSTLGWEVFCDALQDNDTYNRFSGKTVKLGGDIGTAQDPITRMAGSQYHDFCGTFDGQGHTLNVNLNGAQYVAPFFYVKSLDNDHPATIQNLVVDGTVTASGKFAAGIAGGCAGKVNITNCLVDVTISSSVNGDGTHGGLVGVFDGGTLNITGCAFTGKLLSIGSGATTKCGGIVGYSHVSGTAVNITNSLYAPAALVGSETEPTSNSMTFLRSENTTVTITNSYYTRTLGDAQGKQAHSITAGENVTVEVSPVGSPTSSDGYNGVYSVSGITAYAKGITRTVNETTTFYYGQGDDVSLTLSNTAGEAPLGYQYNGFAASAGTLTGSDNPYTLTMPAEDVTISNTLAPIDWATESTGADWDNAYMIYNKDQLDLLAQRVNSGTGDDYAASGYSGRYFRLGADIEYTHNTVWNDATSTEENYTPIGVDDGTNDMYFSGHFDGAGHIISGIRIYKGGNSDADNELGLFGQTDGATVKNIILADARITGYIICGGIVGYNVGGTVENCHALSTVTVHAVKNWAGYHGGIVGQNYGGTVTGCTSAAALTLATGLTNCEVYGGITSGNSSTVENCLYLGTTLNGNKYVGAIAGRNAATVTNSYYTDPAFTGKDNSGNALDHAASAVGYNNGGTAINCGPAMQDNADNTGFLALMAARNAALTAVDRTTPLSTAVDITLNGRTLYKDGDWNTLCLPFALSAEQIAAHADFSGATLMELDKDGKNGFDPTDGTLWLTFKAATAIAAGVPYLVKWAKAADYDSDPSAYDFTSPTFSGVTINATASTMVSDADEGLQEVQMVGCYSPVPVVADDKSILFLGEANTLYYSSIDRDIRSCRAYFSVPYIKQHAQAQARAFRLDFGDGEQTGIMTVQGEGFTVNGADAWYTLDGRKLDGKPATKGLYINGGKKVAIK